MYALNIDKESNRILSATEEAYAVMGMPRVEWLPEGDITHYLYVDGEYEYDPLPPVEEPQPSSENITTEDMAAAIMEGVNEV